MSEKNYQWEYRMKSEFKVLEVIFSRILDVDIDSFFSAYLNSKFKYGKDRDVPCYDGLSYTGILSCLMDEGVVEEDLMRREVSSATKDVYEYKLMLFALTKYAKDNGKSVRDYSIDKCDINYMYKTIMDDYLESYDEFRNKEYIDSYKNISSLISDVISAKELQKISLPSVVEDNKNSCGDNCRPYVKLDNPFSCNNLYLKPIIGNVWLRNDKEALMKVIETSLELKGDRVIKVNSDYSSHKVNTTVEHVTDVLLNLLYGGDDERKKTNKSMESHA